MTVYSVFSSDVAVEQPDFPPLVSRDGDRTVVWLDGEFDIVSAGLMTDALTRAISLDGDLIVDMSGVTFLGTVAIDALMQARSILNREARGLTVRSPSRCATRLLAACGHHDLIEPCLASGPGGQG